MYMYVYIYIYIYIGFAIMYTYGTVPHGTVARVGYRTTDQRDDQGEDVSDLISSAIAWFSAVIAESFCISNSSPSRPRLERLVKEAPLGDAVRPESLILLSLCTCA